MRIVRFRRAQLGVVTGLLAVSMLALPSAGADQQPVQAWEPGVVVLTLFPSIPDTDPYIDMVTDIIENPGGVVEALRPVQDFMRVCGGPTEGRDIVVARFPSEDIAVKAAKQLAAAPGVASVQRNRYLKVNGHAEPPVDADRFAEQWALHNTGQQVGYYHYNATPGADIRALPAWDTGADGSGQIVAILDEGVNINHPDLAPNVWTNTGEIPGNGIDDDNNGWVDDVHGWNYVNNHGNPRPMGHGTNVAGIVAAAADGRGTTGVAPKAQIMSVDFIDGLDARSVTEIRALGAFAYAIANGATIINNSWGLLVPAGIGSPIMTEALRCAERHDIVVAWSAGNLMAVPDWPASYPSPVSIRSTSFNANGCHDNGTQPNPALADVMAPGVDVLTTSSWGDGYTRFGGTSAASPHTAGVAALVRQMYPELSAAEVVNAIRAGSRRDFLEPWSNSFGFLSAIGALNAADNGGEVEISVDGDPMDGSIYRCFAKGSVDATHNFVQWIHDNTGL